MDIEFEFTVDDYIEFHLFYLSNSELHRLLPLSIRVIIACTVFFFIVNMGYSLLSFVIGIIAGIFILAIVPSLNRKSLIRQIKKVVSKDKKKYILGAAHWVQALIGHQVISLSPDSIVCISQDIEIKLNWSTIIRVMQNDHYIFLPFHPSEALVIPKRAFSTEKSLQEFLEYINAHIESNSEDNQSKQIQSG